MRRPQIIAAAAGLLIVCLTAWFFMPRAQQPSAGAIAKAAAANGGKLHIAYPLDGTLFPPEIVAPTFVWKDGSRNASLWFVVVDLTGEGEVVRASTQLPRWRPSEDEWARIKQASVHADAEIFIAGVNREEPANIVSAARVRIRTSTDEVKDSLFYREVPLPFLSAVRDPSRIRWRFGSISSQSAPPIVLENLPVCGNCHSFSANGGVLGLDVDYGNDKGAYTVMPVGKEMVMNDSNIITWADYRRDDDELTFGLLSQVSPDGRYVISTVKDRSVFVATPEIEFSQLFFPVKGILVVYDRETKSFRALPGADDPEYVQSNPSWSPDGKYIVFARSKAYKVSSTVDKNSVLLDETDVPEFVTEKKPFRYDLYRIPFNDGNGGVAQPLEGAANNGMSNYFAKYSPDGKWIVFCKANSYMLLQPDSELYIIPAEGGEARRLTYNTSRMNSWHSWSSNSRWLVFSSKVNRPYTQLLLTHIDDNGNDSPPVLLERFTAEDRAANIPEFVDLPPDAIVRIREEFLDTYSFLRAGLANARTGDPKGAQRSYRRGLEIDPDNAELRNALGWALFQEGKPSEAVAEYQRALAVDPDYVKAHNNIALALIELGRLDEAAHHFKRSVELEPNADIYSDLGFVMDRKGKTIKAMSYYRKALDIDPRAGQAHFNLAAALARSGDLEGAARHYQAVLDNAPSAEARNGLGYVLAKQGRIDEAVAQFEEAIRNDPAYLPAYKNLARNLEKQGKLSEVLSYFHSRLEQQPDPQFYNELGLILVKLDRKEEARRQFELALTIAPDFAQARSNLAKLR